MPNLACGLAHPKVNTMHADGAVWLQNHKNTYDVIIVDSSDPIGPASSLFEESFYATMKEALTVGGVICT